MGSWKTTTTGILMILGALLTIANSLLQTGQLPDGMPLVIATIMGGVGLIKARDDSVTSEDVGADIRSKELERERLSKL